MTTSGSTIISLTRNQFIAAAMRKTGSLSKGQTPDTEDYSNGMEALNNLLAELQTKGMPLWSLLQTTVTMVAGQTSYTIGSGQATNVAFPLKVMQAWVEPTAGGARQDLLNTTFFDFNRLPLGDNNRGTPNQYNYQPFINYGKLRLWPIPDASSVALNTLTIAYMSPFEVFTAASETAYVPQEWNNTIIYGLAYLLAPELGLSLNDRAALRNDYESHLAMALEFGSEEGSVFIQPNWEGKRNGIY